MTSKTERIKAALTANELTWDSPVVDLIDALVFDGDFSGQEADDIVMRTVAGAR